MKAAFTDSEINLEYSDDYTSVIENAIKKAGEKDFNLLITGSFYLASEVKKVLKTL